MQNIILLIIGLVVIGGGIWVYTTSSNPGPAETNVSTEPEPAANQDDAEDDLSGLGSFQSILGLGGSVRCEFTSTYASQAAEGTFYTDGERFRVESTIEGPGTGAIVSNMINDGDFTYTWGTTPEGTMAIKMANAEMDASTDATTTGPAMADEAYVDLEQQVEYDCQRWQADNSAFVPPADIDFMDMEAMMQGAMSNMPEGFEMPEGFPSP